MLSIVGGACLALPKGLVLFALLYTLGNVTSLARSATLEKFHKPTNLIMESLFQHNVPHGSLSTAEKDVRSDQNNSHFGSLSLHDSDTVIRLVVAQSGFGYPFLHLSVPGLHLVLNLIHPVRPRHRQKDTDQLLLIGGQMHYLFLTINCED